MTLLHSFLLSFLLNPLPAHPLRLSTLLHYTTAHHYYSDSSPCNTTTTPTTDLHCHDVLHPRYCPSHSGDSHPRQGCLSSALPPTLPRAFVPRLSCSRSHRRRPSQHPTPIRCFPSPWLFRSASLDHRAEPPNHFNSPTRKRPYPIPILTHKRPFASPYP